MKHFTLTALLVATLGLTFSQAANAGILGQGRYTGFGLPGADTAYGSGSHTPRRRTSSTRRSTRTKRGYPVIKSQPGYVSRGNPVRRRRPVRTRSWVRWTTTYGADYANRVSYDLRRSGYTTYTRRRVIPYRPRSVVVYDVFVWK